MDELLAEISATRADVLARIAAAAKAAGRDPASVTLTAVSKSQPDERLAAMLADDCGACAQLGLRMAVASGVPRPLLADLLDAPEKLPPDLADVRAHAISVVEDDVDPARVARLRARYGEAGLAEMAVCIAGGRIYPSLKRALGREGLCSKPNLEF